jgi:hypothetical protein
MRFNVQRGLRAALAGSLLFGGSVVASIASESLSAFAAPTAATAPLTAIPAPPGVGSISAGNSFACGIRTTGQATCWGKTVEGNTKPPLGTFTQVAVAKYTYVACGIKTTGQLTCWGTTYSAIDHPPSGTFTQVALGGTLLACGIRTTGQATCWGDTYTGSVKPPSGTFTQVSDGTIFVCGIKTTGQTTCWGYTGGGDTHPPAGTTFTQVSNGANFACGLKVTGQLTCWGLTATGDTKAPSGTFTQVAAAAYSACGIRTTGQANCWGDTRTGNTQPPLGTFTQVSASYIFGCGIKTTGRATCWGTTVTEDTNVPPVNFGHPQVSVSGITPCAIKITGHATCWGDVYQRVPPPSGTTFTQVSGGYNSGESCGFTSTGTLKCWGVTPTTKTPTGYGKPPSGTTFTQVSPGQVDTCGINTTGHATCWGYHTVDGDETPPSGTTFTQVSDGAYYFACGIKTTGQLTCWGHTYTGDTQAPSGTFTQVSAGEGDACAIRTTGHATCWGFTHATTPAWAPNNDEDQQAPAGTTFTQVVEGEYLACGIKTTGRVKCWGNTPLTGGGQITSGGIKAPSATFTQLSIGEHVICGIKTTGNATCWGRTITRDTKAPKLTPTTNIAVTTVTGSKTYGSSSATFTGTYNKPSGVAVTGTITCTETLSGTSIANPFLQVGTYEVRPPTCWGLTTTTGNYTFTYAPKATGFTVTKAAIAVTTVSGSQISGSSSPSFAGSYTKPSRASVTGTLTCSELTSGTVSISRALAPGTYTIKATTCSGLQTPTENYFFTYAAKATGFSVTASHPNVAITSLSRTSGPTSGGTQVIITGTGYSTVKNVKFGTTTAEAYAVRSSTQLVAISPAHAAGTVRVSLTAAGGTTASTSADLYKYVVPVPVVSGISPITGRAGTSVTLSGSGFVSGATTVTFGGTVIATGSVTFVSGSQIKVTSPVHAVGTVTVKATTAGGTSATGEQFTYVTGPVITSLSRTTGPVTGGTRVTVTGTGFSTVAKATFGSTRATKWTIKSSTQIVVTAPAHAAGRVGISVTTASGTSPTTSADYYTYH